MRVKGLYKKIGKVVYRWTFCGSRFSLIGLFLRYNLAWMAPSRRQNNWVPPLAPWCNYSSQINDPLGCQPPLRFFFNFSKTIFCQHLPFSVVVSISLRHILTQVWWESVAMVTIYDVISSRWSSHFSVKLWFFAFLGEKSTSCTRKAAKC